MTKKYKIHYKKSECIGAGACEAAFPEGWFFDKETSIATLKDPETKKTDEHEELLITKEELDEYLDSARVCPVMIIEISNIETGEQIFP